jgi:hypothetical protein
MKIVRAVKSPHEWRQLASGSWECARCGFVRITWSDQPDPYEEVAFKNADGIVVDGGCDEVLADGVMGS